MQLLRKIALCVAIASSLSAMAEPDLPKRTVNGKEYYYYEVPVQETIYSIGRKFGYTRDEIIKYNPQVADGLRAYDILYFPVEEKAAQAEQEPAETSEPAKEQVAPEPLTANEPMTANDAVANDEVNVAVMLPFMLGAENMTRAAENNTHFYQGLLLALDNLADKSNYKVNLTAFDTAASPDTVAVLLKNPAIAAMDYIIAPSDSASIELIAREADRHDATVVNLFGVKYCGEDRHESVLQANVTRPLMYASAIEAFCQLYGKKHVIIAHPTDVKSDKADFVKALTDAMVKHGIPYEQISFEGRMSPELLAELPVRDYVVVPTGGSREVLLRVMPTLLAYAESTPGVTVELFGYPEWITHRGEIRDNLHKLNTVIYSRFSADLDSPAAQSLRQSYKKWYGQELPQAVPNTVLLGYDTMAWILFAAENGLTEPYEGVQNSFKVAPAKAGEVNQSVYFIRYNHNGSVDAKVL